MTKIEQAESKLKETQAALAVLEQEAAEIPKAIATAAQAGEVGRVAEQQQRQARLKSEIFVANVANRNAQIAMFEARRADAEERARQAVERRSDLLPRLQKEEQQIIARLHELPIELQRATNAVTDPQKEASDLARRIGECRKELENYLKRESNGEPTPMMTAALMQFTV